MTLLEQLKAWEANMTREELQHAFRIVEANGWHPGDMPPAYVWAEAFRQAAPDKQPKPPTLQ